MHTHQVPESRRVSVTVHAEDEMWQHFEFEKEDEYKTFVQVLSYAMTLAAERHDLIEKQKSKLAASFSAYFQPEDVPPAEEDALFKVYDLLYDIMDHEAEITAEELREGLDNIEVLQSYIALKKKQCDLDIVME